MSKVSYAHLKPGTIIVYLLRSSQCPVHRQREWHGRVKSVYASDWVIVELLDEGYEGLEEPVYIDQIVGIENQPQ